MRALVLVAALAVSSTSDAGWIAKTAAKLKPSISTRDQHGNVGPKRFRLGGVAQFDVGMAEPPQAGKARVGVWRGSPTQWGIVGTYLATHALALHSLVADSLHATPPHLLVEGGLVAGGLYAADATLSGVHWVLDNYFTPTTPFVGRFVKEFRDHHDPKVARNAGNASIPWTMQGFTPIALAALVPALTLGHGNADMMALVTGFAFAPWAPVGHLEAHKLEKEQGPVERKVVGALRKMMLLENADAHLREHHGAGKAHSEHYTTLNGWSSGLLDNKTLRPLRRAEKAIYARTGVMPETWREKNGGAAVMEAALGDDPALLARAREELK